MPVAGKKASGSVQTLEQHKSKVHQANVLGLGVGATVSCTKGHPDCKGKAFVIISLEENEAKLREAGIIREAKKTLSPTVATNDLLTNFRPTARKLPVEVVGLTPPQECPCWTQEFVHCKVYAIA